MSDIARKIAGYSLVVGAVLLLTVNTLVAMGLGGLYAMRGEELADHISRWGIVAPFILGFGGLVLGFVLAEGKKHPLLFLRPFHTVVNELAMSAVAGRLGSGYSIVALDDGTIPPPRRSCRDMTFGLLFFLPAGVLLLFFSALALPAAYEPGSRSFAGQLPAMLSMAFGLLAVRKAFRSLVPRSNRLVVGSARQLEVAAGRVRSLSTWLPRVFFGRSVILQASSPLWQETIRRLGPRCRFAVIDVSRPSANIAWELEFLRERLPGRFIVIAEAQADLGALEREIGMPLLRYRGDPARSAQFARDLRKRLAELEHLQPWVACPRLHEPSRPPSSG